MESDPKQDLTICRAFNMVTNLIGSGRNCLLIKNINDNFQLNASYGSLLALLEQNKRCLFISSSPSSVKRAHDYLQQINVNSDMIIQGNETNIGANKFILSTLISLLRLPSKSIISQMEYIIIEGASRYIESLPVLNALKFLIGNEINRNAVLILLAHDNGDLIYHNINEIIQLHTKPENLPKAVQSTVIAQEKIAPQVSIPEPQKKVTRKPKKQPPMPEETKTETESEKIIEKRSFSIAEPKKSYGDTSSSYGSNQNKPLRSDPPVQVTPSQELRHASPPQLVQVENEPKQTNKAPIHDSPPVPKSLPRNTNYKIYKINCTKDAFPIAKSELVGYKRPLVVYEEKELRPLFKKKDGLPPGDETAKGAVDGSGATVYAGADIENTNPDIYVRFHSKSNPPDSNVYAEVRDWGLSRNIPVVVFIPNKKFNKENADELNGEFIDKTQ